MKIVQLLVKQVIILCNFRLFEKGQDAHGHFLPEDHRQTFN